MTGRILVAISFVLVAAVSCSKGENAATSDAPAAAPAAPSVAGAPATPAPGGKVIVVEMVTDEKGNYFTPAEIEAHQGDVIRFTLRVGVHNVNFLADSNSIKTGLPPASDMLQLPGQTYDLLVNLPEGDYYFQCDPHAALGMKGKLEVED
ncbi:MAG TPA: plastocyanin/azurin family copper-binding protein [Gemmatimonadaceae bacterium]|nr:plastocyanin/azurin family copper-binding protein [Gemmatimonadaceae bacterium]